MVEKVKKILSIPFDTLKGSPDVMLLLSVYSLLYLNKQQPGTCERCMRDYYRELHKSGIERAINYEEMEKRTCVPNWKGIKYISGSFFNSEMITDAQAINALSLGVLRETHFVKMPDGYNQPVEETSEAIEENQPVEETPKPQRGRKPKK